MKKILDVIGAIIISPEFVFVAGFALVVYLEPSVFISLAARVSTAKEQINYLSLVPPGIVLVLMKQKDDLLFPEQHPANNLLQEWPQYHLLLDRYWISVMWGILGSLYPLWVWIFQGDLTNYVTFSIFFCSIITSIITALTFFGATITLKRILSTSYERQKSN
jgi:hypothetical protein